MLLLLLHEVLLGLLVLQFGESEAQVKAPLYVFVTGRDSRELIGIDAGILVTSSGV